MEKIPELTLGNVGQCIYCTTKQSLSKEHIVPYGLNGPWKLLNASCTRCANITRKDELHVLRGPFRNARIAARLPSRRKKEQPQYLPLSIQKEGRTETISVPREDYPAVVLMPHFEEPAYLTGREDKGLIANGLTTFQLGGLPVAELGDRLSAEDMRMEFRYEPVGAFARMLAKIAYGFAVVAVSCDLTQFRHVYVLPTILGGGDDVGRWVGGSGEDELPAVSDLHHIRFGLVDGEIILRVRLFARYGTPEYCIIVGRLREKKSLADIELPQGAHWIY